MAGIFDIKWGPVGNAFQTTLGAALADGSLRLLRVADNEGAPDLREVAHCAALSSGMCLSLDWQPRDACSARIAVSGSAGTLSLVQATEAALVKVSEWEAHSLEAWCTAFQRGEQADVLFSGADDCVFRAHDIRADPASPTFADRRTHTAGVCTVSPHPTRHHVVATGSYDEHVRVWDMRNARKPLVCCQANTGGGNWRLRWHPTDERVLLAACMYNGFAVLRADGGFSELSITDTYQSPNKHIGYGADWWRDASGPGADGLTLAATCSFYDRLFTLAWLRTE